MIYSLAFIGGWAALLVSNVSPRLTGWTTWVAALAALDIVARLAGI